MRDSHRVLVATLVAALLGGAAPAAAQDAMLTRANNGDLEASWTGEEPAEFVLVTATVDRDGNVLERTEGRTIVLKPGQDINVPSREIVPGGGVAYDSFVAVRSPKPYTPGRDGMPAGKYFLLYEDELDTPKVDGVRAGPSGTGKTMDKSSPKLADQENEEAGVDDQGVMPGDNANVVRKRPGRTTVTDSDNMQPDPSARGIKPDRGGKDVFIKPDRGGKDVFYIVTLVPADERAPRVNVQPVILHGAAPDDKPDW